MISGTEDRDKIAHAVNASRANLVQGQICSNEWSNFTVKRRRNECAATRSWQCCQAQKPLPPSTQNITYLSLFVFQFLRRQLHQVLMPFSEALGIVTYFPPLQDKINWLELGNRCVYGSILKTGALGNAVLIQPCPEAQVRAGGDGRGVMG